jgi:hypothetical protein
LEPGHVEFGIGRERHGGISSDPENSVAPVIRNSRTGAGTAGGRRRDLRRTIERQIGCRLRRLRDGRDLLRLAAGTDGDQCVRCLPRPQTAIGLTAAGVAAQRVDLNMSTSKNTAGEEGARFPSAAAGVFDSRGRTGSRSRDAMGG